FDESPYSAAALAERSYVAAKAAALALKTHPEVYQPMIDDAVETLLAEQAKLANFTGVWGNVSGSGTLGVTDARMVLQYLVGKGQLTAAQIELAKVSGGTALGITDVRWMLQKIVGKIDKFPVEN
ncbi:MAG: hypothetical protein FWE80_09370, partial [Oscillospiraceae bacterium]|nr:hypothetical protein [Oscillospiraceae bacterium]